MVKFDVVGLGRDCRKEYEKHTVTQQSIIDDFLTFMKDYIDLVEKSDKRDKRKKGIFNFKIFNKSKKDREILQLQQYLIENSKLSKEDVRAAVLMSFTFRGITCGIADYCVIMLIKEDIENTEGYVPKLDFTRGKIGEVLNEYMV